MKLRDYLNESRVELGAELYSKEEALERLIELQKHSGAIHNIHALRREIIARERQGSSAVSGRIAIPDVMHSGAKESSVSVVTLKNGVDYHAPDKRPVKLIFMIAGKSGSDEHTVIKERLMHLLTDAEFVAKLCAAESTEEFLSLIDRRESRRSR